MNSNQRNFAIICVSLLLIAVVVYGMQKANKVHNTPVPVAPDPVVVVPSTQVEYKNTTYGFTFSLPKSWEGYTIVEKVWEGILLETDPVQKVSGPIISIRHPLWTKEIPRQDIPVMVFTPDQWSLIQQEKLSAGAAPIPPSELGRNSTYVFALPARYNFAFPQGFEEVQTILDGKPLQGF